MGIATVHVGVVGEHVTRWIRTRRAVADATRFHGRGGVCNGHRGIIHRVYRYVCGSAGAGQAKIVGCNVVKIGAAVPIGIGRDIQRQGAAACRVGGVDYDSGGFCGVQVERDLDRHAGDGKAGDHAIDIVATQGNGKHGVLIPGSTGRRSGGKVVHRCDTDGARDGTADAAAAIGQHHAGRTR